MIECFRDKIDVFVGKTGGCIIGSGLSLELPVCVNGHSIQLNLELSELEDLKDDKFFAEAVSDKKPEIQVVQNEPPVN